MRRVKCDETKPICMQCKRTNRSCIVPSVPTSLSQLPQVPSTSENWATIDAKLDQYFMANISSIASDEFNCEFWQHHVLQARVALPAVRLASNALACLKWTRNPKVNLSYMFTQSLDVKSSQSYSASIKYVFDLMQAPHPSPEEKTTVLLASIFYYRYALDWNSIWAIISKSCQLIRYWRYWECLDSDSVSGLASHILYYFVKAERARQESLCEAPARPINTSWLEAIMWLQRKPLNSTVHAYLEVEMIYISLRGIMENLPFRPLKRQIATASAERATLFQCFKLWERRLMRSRSSFSKCYSIQVAIIDVRRTLVDILFKVNLEDFVGLWSETCWDGFEREFACALGLVESVLAEACDTTCQAYNDIHYTPSLYKSLTFIARFCRSTTIRHRAADIVRVAIPTALSRSYVTVPVKSRDHKPFVKPMVVDFLISVEESAWTRPAAFFECSAGKGCIRHEYVCNMHRVARISHLPFPDRIPEFTFCTVADLVQGIDGQKYSISRLVVF